MGLWASVGHSDPLLLCEGTRQNDDRRFFQGLTKAARPASCNLLKVMIDIWVLALHRRLLLLRDSTETCTPDASCAALTIMSTFLAAHLSMNGHAKHTCLEIGLQPVHQSEVLHQKRTARHGMRQSHGPGHCCLHGYPDTLPGQRLAHAESLQHQVLGRVAYLLIITQAPVPARTMHSRQ